MLTLPRLAELELSPIVSMATLEHIKPEAIPAFLAHILSGAEAANLLMNQYSLFSITGNTPFALEMLQQALAQRCLYRVEGNPAPTIRLLALMGPGDTSDNTPLDYLLVGSDIRLDLLYVLPDTPLPEVIPDHDVAIVALGESSKNLPLLAQLEQLIEHWPRPVLNRPDAIRHCARHHLSQRLSGLPGVCIPPTHRLSRTQLEAIATGASTLTQLLGTSDYPFTVRPLDTQAGQGLAKIDTAQAWRAYLDATAADEFYVSCFNDYRSADGLYRKARIALIDGEPYVAHLAIGTHWIVHYQSAGMHEQLARREEEQRFMDNFDSDFGLRHGAALRLIAARLALDYVVLDCAETAAGALLVFEADNRGWVHATDPLTLFSYKQAPLQKLFGAFRTLLQNTMQRSHALHQPPPDTQGQE